MASWRDCVGLALGRPLKDKEAKQLEDRFERARYRRRQEGLADDDAALGALLAKELEVEAAIAKRNIHLNRLADAAWKDYRGNFKDGALALKSLLGGSAARVKGARDSIDARTKGVFTDYLGGFLADLRIAGKRLDLDLVGLTKSREFELPLRQALRGETVDGPMAAAAREVATIAHKYFDAGRLRENAAGSWIGKLDGFDGTQSHDPARVWRAGHKAFQKHDKDAAFKAWRDEILPRLDADRTFTSANHDAYVDAYQYPAKCFANSATVSIFACRLHNARTRYCLIISPRVAGDYATTGLPRAIAYQGDNFSLDLAGGQYDGNIIEYNRIEGAFFDGAICVKLAHGVESERTIVRNNTIRGARVGIYALMAVAVHGGSTYNTSYTFGPGNDVHATLYFVFNEHIAGEHLFDLDDNDYRDDDGADWRDGGNTRTTLAAWQGAVQSGDTHDTNSTTSAIPASTDVSTITINDTTPVVGQTLTATFADDDADGAGSDIRYEWRSNDRVVGGANSATYTARPQDLGFALKAVAFYTSGGNRKVCVSAATSAVGAGTYARKAVAVAA